MSRMPLQAAALSDTQRRIAKQLEVRPLDLVKSRVDSLGCNRQLE